MKLLWGRSKTAVVETPAPGRINDRALLDYNGKRYPTLVEDVTSSNVCVAAPCVDGKCIVDAGETPVILNLIAKNGLHRYSAKVLEIKKDSVPLVMLGGFKYLGILQRRQHPRLSEKLTIRYRQEMAGKIIGEDWLTSITIDISAGGLLVRVDPERAVQIGEILEIELSLPGLEDPINASCRIVRFSTPEYGRLGLKRMGLAFTRIEPSDRDSIHRYVKRRQEELDTQRRVFERVRLHKVLDMEFRLESEKTMTRQGVVFEMGVGGLKFAVDNIEGLNPGVVLEMSIKLFERRSVAAVAEIIHVEASPKGEKRYSIGVRCKYLNHSDLEAIVAFLG